VPDRPKVVAILDPDEDAYRVGHGDPKGIELLLTLVERSSIALRSHPGLRIGVLIADGDILLWAPTPKAVEGDRTASEPRHSARPHGGCVGATQSGPGTG
jgi:hypothetical protein